MERHFLQLGVLYLLLLHAEVVDSTPVLRSPVLVNLLPDILYQWLNKLLDNPVLSLLSLLSQLVQFFSTQYFFGLLLREVTNLKLDIAWTDHAFVSFS